MIDRSLERIDNFRRDFRYLEQETKEWEKQAEDYIVKLPEQMNEMFQFLNLLVNNQQH